MSSEGSLSSSNLYDGNDYDKLKEIFLKEIKNFVIGPKDSKVIFPYPQKSESVKNTIKQIENRKKELKNQELEQKIELKKKTLDRLFFMLEIETSIVFIFSLFQAIHWPHCFRLEEWSFKLLITATIAQITFMLNIAVKHLFPNKK